MGDVVWCRRPHDKRERHATPVRDASQWVECRNAHPALVSRDLFARVQAILARNKREGRASRGNYLLSGLIRCAHCGEPYVGAGGPKGPPDDPDRYRFYADRGGREPRPVCHGILGTLQRRHVEPAVLAAIGKFVAQPVVQKIIAEELDRQLRAGMRDEAAGAAEIRKARKRLEGERARIVRAIGRGVLADDDAREELERIRQVLCALEGDRDRAQFADRRRQTLQAERDRLLRLASDFPVLAKRLTGAALRELVRPWLADAIVDKVARTLTLAIRRIPDTALLILEPSPGRG